MAESEYLSLWEVLTTHPRMNQVRLHAAEVGLPVYGETVYGAIDLPSNSKVAHNERKRTPRFSGLGMVLTEIDLSQILPEGTLLSGGMPKPFTVLLRKCGLIEEY